MTCVKRNGNFLLLSLLLFWLIATNNWNVFSSLPLWIAQKCDKLWDCYCLIDSHPPLHRVTVATNEMSSTHFQRWNVFLSLIPSFGALRKFSIAIRRLLSFHLHWAHVHVMLRIIPLLNGSHNRLPLSDTPKWIDPHAIASKYTSQMIVITLEGRRSKKKKLLGRY